MNIKFLNEYAKIPTRGSDEAAGFDLYAAIAEPVTIPAHETRMVGTGFALEVPVGFFAGIYPRSGLASKQGLRPANCVGVCDSDYRGEYIVALHNDTNVERTVNPGDRIAQLIFHQCCIPDGFTLVDELAATSRGAGGFGSTGQ